MSLRAPRWRWAVAATAALLGVASCGSDGATSSTDAPSAVPSTTVPSSPAPTKIISLSPTGTEMLFAIGAGSQVIAVDDQSNYPPDALKVKTDLSGFTPNVEAIAARKPDLVIVQPDSAGQLESQLKALGIDVFARPPAETFKDIYAQIEQLGAMTGHVADAAKLVADMQSDIAKAVAAAPKLDKPLTYFHEVDNTLYSVGTKSFIGEAYGLFGLKNIVDADAPAAGFPQLTNEAVIAADPDLIFLSDADYGESPATVAARPGWAGIAAVKHGNVIPVSADLSSRWGPRIVDYVEAVSAALVKAQQTAKA